ncbi:MAG: hypothetical protein ACOCYO_03970 [Bacteroidota bacterium]
MKIKNYEVEVTNKSIHIIGSKMPPTIKELRYIINKLIREKKADEGYRVIT